MTAPLQNDALPEDQPIPTTRGQDRASSFSLDDFLPYLLNQAAEATSRSFAVRYKAEYGLTRTQWRVIAHLGRFGSLTAVDVCRLSQIEKTKVSRAVAALTERGWISRVPEVRDRRRDVLQLTTGGHVVLNRLGANANAYDAALRDHLGTDAAKGLVLMLRRLIGQGSREDLPHD